MKKKKKPAFHKFFYNEKLYHTPIILCVGDLGEFHKYAERTFEDQPDDENRFLSGFYTKYILRVNEHTSEAKHVIFINEPDDFYTLSHEIVHLCRTVFIDRGIPTDLKDNDETFAYLHTHLLKILWRKMGKLQKPLPKKK